LAEEDGLRGWGLHQSLLGMYKMSGKTLFRVFLDNEIIMEKVVLAISKGEGVALKDDFGVTKIIENARIAEINVVGEFIQLRRA